MAVTIDGTTGVSLVQDGVITDANLPAGSVLQMVQAVKTTTQSFNLNTNWADISGLSQAITPSSASNKILIMVHVNCGQQNGSNESYPKIRLQKNGSNVGVSTESDNRQTATSMWSPGTAAINAAGVMSMTWLDSPATTSSTTYKVQAFGSQSRLYYVNSTGSNENTAGGQAVSTITLMEIAG